jgi:peptidoglycan/xylan/chitin deacetylase (PgdA/CDA1 family)
VLTFHRVVSVCEKDHDITWDAFYRVLDEIARSGRSVDSELVFGPAAAGSAAILTFDDGTADHLRVAEVLAARGMSGIFFIPAVTMGMCGRLTAGEVRALRALGHCVGSHGLTDAPIGAAADDVLRRELGESRAILEDRVGGQVVYFAPPGGRLSARARRALPGFGYLASRSMRWGICGAHEDRFSIPCIPVTEYTLARGWVSRAVVAGRVPASMRSASVVRRIIPDAIHTRVRRMLHAPFLARDRAR